MNIMQFWVIDTFIKHKTLEKTPPTIRLDQDEEDAETLLRRSSEEDEEEPTDPPPRYDDERDNYMNHPVDFIQASSSTETPSSRENEYELKSKHH